MYIYIGMQLGRHIHSAMLLGKVKQAMYLLDKLKA